MSNHAHTASVLLGREQLGGDSYELDDDEPAPREPPKVPIPSFVVAVRFAGERDAMLRAFGSRPPAQAFVFVPPNFKELDVDGVRVTRLGDETVCALAPAPILNWVLDKLETHDRGAPVATKDQIARRTPLARAFGQEGMTWSKAEGVSESPFEELCPHRSLSRFLGALALDALALPQLAAAGALPSDVDRDVAIDQAGRRAIFPHDALGAPLDALADEAEAQAAQRAKDAERAAKRDAEILTGTPASLGLAAYVLDPGPTRVDGSFDLGESEAIGFGRWRWPWELPESIWFTLASGSRRARLVTDRISLQRGAAEHLAKRPLPDRVWDACVELARKREDVAEPITEWIDGGHPGFDRRARAMRALLKHLGPVASVPESREFLISANVAIRVLALRPDLAARIFARAWAKPTGARVVRPAQFAPFAQGRNSFSSPGQGLGVLLNALAPQGKPVAIATTESDGARPTEAESSGSSVRSQSDEDA